MRLRDEKLDILSLLLLRMKGSTIFSLYILQLSYFMTGSLSLSYQYVSLVKFLGPYLGMFSSEVIKLPPMDPLSFDLQSNRSSSEVSQLIALSSGQLWFVVTLQVFIKMCTIDLAHLGPGRRSEPLDDLYV